MKHIPPPPPERQREREQSVTLKMQAQMGVGLHVQWSLKMSDLNENWNGLTFFTKFFSIILHEIWSAFLELLQPYTVAAVHICECA